MEQNHHEGASAVGGGGSNVLHSSSEEEANSTRSHSLHASLWLKFQDTFTKFVLAMQQSSWSESGASSASTTMKTPSYGGWKRKTLSLLYYMYMFWISLFLPTLGSYHWGQYGDWLFTVLNYPITLSFHLLPYNAIVALGVASMLLILSGSISFMLALHAIVESSKNLDRLKKNAATLGQIIQALSMIMTFIFTSFIDCDTRSVHSITSYSDDEKVYALSRFSSSAAYDRIPCKMTGNIVLIIFMILNFFPMLIINFLTVMISSSQQQQRSEPTVGSKGGGGVSGFFIGDNNIPMAYLSISNPLQLMLMYVVPVQYAYIRSLIHIVFTVVLVVLVVYLLPFYRMIENSIVCGIAVGRIGAAIGSLVTFIVLSNVGGGGTGLPVDNDILGISLGAGLTLGLMIVGFLCGLCGLQIYISLIYSKVRSRFMVSIRRAENLSSILRRTNQNGDSNEKLPLKMLEKEAQLLFQEFQDENRLKHLSLFFKFSLKSKNRTSGSGSNGSTDDGDDDDDSGITDCEIALSIIKGASLQKSFNDPQLLLTSSLIVSNSWRDEVNSQVFASNLLKKALKSKPNVLYKFLILERKKEYDMMDQSNHSTTTTSQLYELKFFLQRMENNQSELSTHHKVFWKEMTNDLINFEKIEQTNSRASELMSDCESTFQNLMARYRNNKNVLRCYASYLEKFKFNKELALELYQEAMTIEDDDQNKIMKFRPSFKMGVGGGGGNKKNRVLPTFDDTNFKFSSAESPTVGHRKNSRKTSTVLSQTIVDFNEGGGGDDLIESSAEDSSSQRLDGIENNPQMKRESTLRTALATPQQHNAQRIAFILFVTVSALLLVSGVVWNSVISSLVLRDIKIVQNACQPRMVPLLALRTIRLQQTYLNLYQTNPQSDENLKLLRSALNLNSTAEFILNVKTQLSKSKHFINELRVMGQKGQFTTPEMYSDYTDVNKQQIILPNVDSPNDLGIFNNTQPSNVSITQMVYVLMKYISHFEEKLSNSNGDGDEVDNYINSSSTLTSFPFMYLWLNQETFQQAFDGFCQNFITRSQQQAELLEQSFFIYFVASNSLYGVLTIVYIVYVTSSFSSLKRFVRLLEKTVPKDVIGKIYHQLQEKQFQQSDETHGGGASTTAIQQLLPKRFLKPSMSAAIIGLLIVSITIACSGMFYMESGFNTQSLFRTMLNIKEATTVLSTIQRSTFIVGELFNFVSLPNDGGKLSNINDPRLFKSGDSSNNDGVNSYKSEMKTLSTTLISSWNHLIYGQVADKKLPIVGISSKIDSIIQDSNCTTANNNNTSTTSSSTTSCTRGLEHLIEIFSQLSSENTEAIFASKSSSFKLFTNQMKIHVLADSLTERLLIFLDTIISVLSVSSISFVVSFSLVGSFLLLILSYGLYSIFNSHWNNLFHIRIMFNYIPLDLMDSEETIRNFIMYHTLPSRFSIKMSDSSSGSISKEKKDDSNNKVRNILNAAVDGAVLCSHRGDIEIFNPAAQRMFGCKQTDFVGLPLFKLFDSNNRDLLGKVIKNLTKSFKENRANIEAASDDQSQQLQQGETIEVDCIRKNNTKFPAKVNLFSTLFDNKPVVTCFIKDITSERKQNALLAEEKKKSENLLRSVLPEQVANRLKSGETFIADRFDDITCFFSDMVGFTAISSCLSPTEIVKMLNTIVNGFDLLTDKYQLEKIKTIGDAYFCVGGIGSNTQSGDSTTQQQQQLQSDHPERTLRFAMDIFQVLRNYNLENFNHQVFGKHQINVRVGINTGSVIAGVIGTKKFAYDLWGDTINMASRMESTSLSGRIQVSRSTYERVVDLGFEFDERTLVEVKGKGLCTTYMMKAHHHASAIVVSDSVVKLEENALQVLNSDKQSYSVGSNLSGTSTTNELEEYIFPKR